MEFISKAYQALTDPISRENYEKYGHPDGRQVLNFHAIRKDLLLYLSKNKEAIHKKSCLKPNVLSVDSGISNGYSSPSVPVKL